MSLTYLSIIRVSIPLAALLLATSCDTGPVRSAARTSATTTRADALRWETLESGVRIAVLYGDRTKAQPFGLRLRYPAGYRKEPHYHPSDAFVTVLSGSYRRGYGNAFDESRGIQLVAGTFSVNPAGVAHFEWVEEPAELEVHATGPWGSVYVDADGRAVPGEHQRRCGDACGGSPGTSSLAPAVSTRRRPPTVLRPEELRWTPRADGDEVAVLFGDPARSGPFVLRIRSSSRSREEPHWHPHDAYITVLSGDFRFGIGRVFEPATAVEVGRLDTLAVPAGQLHYKWNDGPSVVEVHATGPWSTTWIKE